MKYPLTFGGKKQEFVGTISSSYSVEVRSTEFYNVLRATIIEFVMDKQIKIKLNECLHQNPNKIDENFSVETVLTAVFDHLVS